ncbi:MAG TPA: ABC transporter substrate-binding protein [Saprospiraceae bacterium]|nr:ABC transporter substrate-binding protein [Saprospiraceae bacterium]HMQ81374.1 ABC transporter substrate-binding protein [Saprospiraceae bacterium]
MISVPNRLQPSNGSKWLFLLIGLIWILPSCELFKKAQSTEEPAKDGAELDPIPGRKIYDPETGTLVVVEQTPVEIMDTIKWRDIPVDSIPPIKSSKSNAVVEEGEGPRSEFIRNGEFGTAYYTAYQVSVVLPFLSNQFSASTGVLPENSDWALQFYGGVQLALEDLNEEGVKLNVNVMDSKASDKEVSRLTTTRTELLNSHLIIGPYRRECVQVMAEFAKRSNITFVSPHSSAAGVSSNNPNYIQVSPSLKSHCEAITEHVRKRFRPNQVVLVARDSDAEKDRFAYFQNKNYIISGTRADSVQFREYLVKESSTYQNIDLRPYLGYNDTTVFILPSWSSETFIYSFLSKLKLTADADNYVEVYGMPQWMSYEKIDIDLYETLNVHVSSDVFLDGYDQDVRFFRQRFFDRYGAIPKDEATLGYDVMLYCGRMINKYGTKFQYWMEREAQDMLHTRFDFERVVRAGQTTGFENAPIEQFENKFVNILRFQDYQFQPTN